MRITLTGATGFIGSRLVNRLLGQRDSVTILSRSMNGGVNPHYVIWNPGNGATPTAALDQADAVIHLAGEPIAQRWTSHVKKRIWSSRVDATRRLVDALASVPRKPAVLISSSAIGIYGDRGDEIVTEASAPGAGFLADICVAWEREAMRAEEFGIRVVTLRTGVVLGRRGALSKMLPMFKAGLGGSIGSGRQWMSWIHVEDVAALIQFALSAESIRGPVNATSPEPVTNIEFTRELATSLRRPALFSVPKFALRLAYGEMANVLFDSQRVIPEAAQAAGFRFKYTSLVRTFDQILGQ